jgi:hypothetical protein
MFQGLLSDLQSAFRKRSTPSAPAPVPERPTPATPPPARTSVPATTGTFSAPLRTSPKPAAPANLSDTSPVNLSSTDAFKIPIGVPEPERLYVLRNYLRVSSTGTVIRLSEAMRLCAAKEDVVGHRLHAQRVFHEEGWAIIGQTRGDPMFTRLSTAMSGPEAASVE